MSKRTSSFTDLSIYLVTTPCPHCGIVPRDLKAVAAAYETGDEDNLRQELILHRYFFDADDTTKLFCCDCQESFDVPKHLRPEPDPPAADHVADPVDDLTASTTREPVAKSVKRKPVKRTAKTKRSVAKPKRNPQPQLYKDHIRQLDADPLEGIITPDCRMFFQSVFCSGSSFRAIVRMDLRTKAHYLADIGTRSFHLEPIQKDLLEFRRRLALGTADDKLMQELTNEQYCSKFIRDAMVSVHKEWNAGELSEQLREAYSRELRNKPKWAERLTGKQSLDFIRQLKGKTVAISALRKMAERKHNLKVPGRNDLYFRDSIVEHYG